MCTVYVPPSFLRNDYDPRLVPGSTVFFSGMYWILKSISKFDGSNVGTLEDKDGDTILAWLDQLKFVCYFNENDVECVE